MRTDSSAHHISMTDPPWSRGFHVKHFGSKRRRKFLGGPVDDEKTSMNFPNTAPAPILDGPSDGPNPDAATALLDREQGATDDDRVDTEQGIDTAGPADGTGETILPDAADGAENPHHAVDAGDPDSGHLDSGDPDSDDSDSDDSDSGHSDPGEALDNAPADDQGSAADAADDATTTTEDPEQASGLNVAGISEADASDSTADVDIVTQRDDVEDTPLAREIADLTRRRSALAAEQLPLPDKTRIFTVANQKGGVGKTTTTVNLAAALARGGSRVLVIDLDPQGNASTALGVDHRADIPSVYDVIIDDEPMTEIVQKSPEFDGLYCLPATIHLAGAEIELVSMVAREQRLRTSLLRFLDETPEAFHYVFIDCPPSLGLLTINAFVAASEVLIPIQCEYYALEGLSQLLNNISLIEKHLNPTLNVSTILLTMFDSRTNLANQVAQDVRDHFPDQVLPTPIPRSVRISEAPSYGQTVISYDSNSAGSLSYREAAAEIARRGAPN